MKRKLQDYKPESDRGNDGIEESEELEIDFGGLLAIGAMVAAYFLAGSQGGNGGGVRRW